MMSAARGQSSERGKTTLMEGTDSPLDIRSPKRAPTHCYLCGRPLSCPTRIIVRRERYSLLKFESCIIPIG